MAYMFTFPSPLQTLPSGKKKGARGGGGWEEMGLLSLLPSPLHNSPPQKPASPGLPQKQLHLSVVPAQHLRAGTFPHSPFPATSISCVTIFKTHQSSLLPAGMVYRVTANMNCPSWGKHRATSLRALAHTFITQSDTPRFTCVSA